CARSFLTSAFAGRRFLRASSSSGSAEANRIASSKRKVSSFAAEACSREDFEGRNFALITLTGLLLLVQIDWHGATRAAQRPSPVATQPCLLSPFRELRRNWMRTRSREARARPHKQ